MRSEEMTKLREWTEETLNNRITNIESQLLEIQNGQTESEMKVQLIALATIVCLLIAVFILICRIYCKLSSVSEVTGGIEKETVDFESQKSVETANQQQTIYRPSIF